MYKVEFRIWYVGFFFIFFMSDKYFLFIVILFILVISMVICENLKKINISVLCNIVFDLGINLKKKKKDDLICDILFS